MTFKINKLKINISVYFAAIILFTLLFAQNSSVLMILICCVMHETGHLTAIYLLKGKVSAICFGAYGMRIEPYHSSIVSPQKEVLVSFAGPFVNIVLLLIGILAHSPTLFKVNFSLCVFNLLPIGKTDGYNTIYNILIQFADHRKTEAVLKKISTAFLITIYLIGIVVFFRSNYNFSLFAVAVYLTIINTR